MSPTHITPPVLKIMSSEPEEGLTRHECKERNRRLRNFLFSLSALIAGPGYTWSYSTGDRKDAILTTVVVLMVFSSYFFLRKKARR